MVKVPGEALSDDKVARQAAGDGWTLCLVTTADRMTASVQLTRSKEHETCAPENVIELVRSAGLCLSVEEEERLPGLAQQLCDGVVNAVVVAKGAPAGTWGNIDWLIPMGIGSLRDYSDETIDLHEVSQFINVRKGQPLCLLPPAPAAGRTVFGEAIVPPACPFQLGDRVSRDPQDSAKALATEPGCVRFANGRLSVEQILQVSGDLTFKIGNIDFSGNVAIHGNVLDDFHIKCTKNVVVDGSVGMSTIEAGGDIVIKGGVNGGHKGKLVSGGDLQAHYLHRVDVECAGDVAVDVEIHDSQVRANGSCSVIRGGIIGGSTCAGRSVSAGFIGASMSVPTLVHAGFNLGLDDSIARPRKALASARATLHSLESLLADLQGRPGVTQRFPSQNKTQLTQVQARLADARILEKNALVSLSSRMHEIPLAGASITTRKQLYPKVTLIIDSICEEETIVEQLGPAKLVANSETLAIESVPATSAPSRTK